MSPELHQRVRKLFEDALEQPEAQRTAFLDSACGAQPEVRQAVERLLAAHRSSGAFLTEEKGSERRLGRYVVTRELGRGSMGVVFEGLDPLIGRHVAVKVIRIESATDGSQVAIRDQFFREAHSAGRLLHPGIVVIFDVGQQGDAAFIAMELVEGPSLQELLSANPRPPVADTLEILRQAAAALDYAHENGIVHRDIKPANIMLHKGHTVKIADFGVAKINTLQNLTATGLILGTPTYMSPEQLEMQPLDGRSDQFSLAVVAYEMCTGSRPFEAPSLAPLTHLIVYGDRPSARHINPALSEAADAVLRKGLAKLPAGRYQSCSEFVTALASALREASAASITEPMALQDLPMVTPPHAPPTGSPMTSPPPTGEPFQPPTAPHQASATFQPPTAPHPPSAAFQPPTAEHQPSATFQPPAPHPPSAAFQPPAAPPPPRKSGNPAVVLLLVACAFVALILGGGVWLYMTKPWKSLATQLASSKAPAPAAPAPSAPAPAAPTPTNPAPAALPSVARFAASTDSIVAGKSATLEWDVKDAAEVRIEPQVGKVAASGTMAVQPVESTTYLLTATGPGGQSTARVSISVAAKAPVTAEPANTAASLYESGLAERRLGHSEKALANFRRAAEQGDVRAMIEVAEEELDNDNSDSERWFRKAADLGDATAMLNLGAMYQLGNHVKEDLEKAVYWYRIAAEKGNPSAMYNLGRMYERGHGVPKDLAKAKELYQKAAAKGNSDARGRLDQLTDK